MCEQCSAATVEIGEFAPGWRLVRATRDGRVMKAGQYGLVQHDDPTYYLSIMPEPAPDTDTETDEDNVRWFKFSEVSEPLIKDLVGSPLSGYDLVSACDMEGCKDDEELSLFHQWLCDRLGRLIAGVRFRTVAHQTIEDKL